MDTERWARIEALYVAALERSVEQRAAFLAHECADDPALRVELENMLAASHESLAIERRLLTTADPDPGLAAGTPIGPYQIQELCGRGGMGEVYRAERVDGEFQQTVAIKVLRAQWRTTDMMRRFRTERQILARLVHPDIAAILDGGALDDGRPYLVLQFIDGVPITDYCEQRGLSVRERLQLLRRVAAAVQFAHSHLVIHRDLKPTNILVTAQGDPVLLDFGIAKLLEADADHTRAEVKLLTPEHAAPEQLRGEPVSTATDVYGLGVLLCELLTGQRPVSLAGRTRAQGLRGDLDRVVLKALHDEPERRYESAGQLADDIDRYLAGQPVRAQPDTLRYRTSKFIARNRALAVSLATVALLLVGFATTTAIQARRVAAERDVARQQRASAEAVVGLLTNLFEHANPFVVPGGDTIRVSALLEAGERRIEALHSQPALQARMWRVLGNMHAARSRYDRARDLLQRSYEQQRRLAGDRDSVTLLTYHELARVVLAYQGQKAAAPMFDTSVARLREVLGDRHPDVAGALEDRARASTDPQERRPLLDTASAIKRATGDSMSLAASLNVQGTERFGRGHFREAKALYEESLQILEQLLSQDHPNRLAVTGNLAAAETRLAQWNRADSLQRIVLAGKRRVFGERSVAYATSAESAALLAAHRGRLREAEEGLRASLATFRELLAPNHLQIQNTLRNLALVLNARGERVTALALLDTAIAMQRTRDGEATANYGYFQAQRSIVLLELGRIDEASAAALLGDRLIREHTVDTDMQRAEADLYVGLTAFARGDVTEAERRFAAVASSYRQFYPTTHPAQATVVCLLGIVRANQNRVPEAARDLPSCTTYERGGMPSPTIVQWARAARRQMS